MPLVGYLLSVGIALFLDLVSGSAYLTAGPDSAAKLTMAPTTASLVSGTPSKY
jgi:MFS superfamily sulfate permease-like transporter